MVKHSRKKSRKAHRKSYKMKGGVDRTLEIDDLNERKPRDLETLDLSVISNSDDDDHDFGLNDSLNLDNTNMRDSVDTINESMTNIGDDYDYNNDSSTLSNGSLHLSDLNGVAENENSIANTTIEDDSIGGKKRIRTMKKRKMMKRKTMKKIRTTKKRKQTKKQKGGMCYGNGVGANSYDPNFSIYNTRELELFPYKPK